MNANTTIQVESRYPETVTAIYRCSKQCEKAAGRKVAKRIIFPMRRVTEPDRFGGKRTVAVFFQTPEGYDSRYLPEVHCGLCGRSMFGQIIAGRFNKEIKCDARCTNAVGHQCECSCGGKNHGSQHA